MKSSTNDDFAPAPTVGALLRLAWLTFRREMYKRVREAGYTDLQPAQLLVFRYPTIDGLRPGELAEEAGLSKQGINDLLRQLEARGYLELRPDPDDRRAKRIELTERGYALMDLLYSAARDVAEHYEHIVGRKRYAELHKTLVEITGR